MFTTVRAPATRALARSFSTTQAKLDVSKLTLVGRLGAEPVERKTSTDKPYFTYAVATQGPAVKDADGNYTDGHTSWHNVFSFNENQHPQLRKLGKGSTIYVEADLEMRRSEQADGPAVDRVFLRQLSLRTINKVKPESESAETDGADAE